MGWLARICRSANFGGLLQDIFALPYRLLPHLVFIFAVLCWIIHPNGAIRTGMLADTDDYMRLNEVVGWLQGQGWHDLSYPRLSPGTHTVVHWARLLDLPLALVMLPLIKIMGMQNAALFASFIIPPATFALLLWLSSALAEIFVGKYRANLAAPLTLFAPLTLMNFVPGRVDHHGYQVLIAGFGLLALDRILESRAWKAYAIGTAVLFACGLWIGTEALPWVILFVGCLAMMAAWRDGDSLPRAALFGVAFFLASVLVLPLAVPPAEYTSLALSWYSAADVVFAGIVAVMFLAAWQIQRWIGDRRLGFILMPMLGLASASVFARMVPDVWNGPFADYDDFDATIALDSIGEAVPLARQLRWSAYNHLQDIAALLHGTQSLLLALVGLIAVGYVICRSRPALRVLLLPRAVFLAVAIGLTVFWQLRVGWFMQFFAIAPLTWLLVLCWDKIAARYAGRPRFWLEILAFLALGFIPTVLIPAMAGDAPLVSDVLLFPAARPAPACPLRTASKFLSESWGYGATTHTIMSSGNEGPELLFRTPHNVIAANFNVAGNVDAYDFFGARDDAAAQKILQRWKVDLILMCRSFPIAYAHLDHPRLGSTVFLELGTDGKLHLSSDPDHPTLVERLARGTIPPWLKPVEIPSDKDYLLFEVIPSGITHS